MACNVLAMTARFLRAACILWVTCLIPYASAQQAGELAHSINKPSALKSTSGQNSGKHAVKPTSKPTWSELTPKQQEYLAPLAADWDKLDGVRKKKWLELAAKYPKMSTAEQQRIQERMRDWAKLTPEQRRIARESYARAKKLNTNQKTAEWQEYQKLPEEQKKKLAADAAKKKNVANLPRPSLHKNKAAQQAKPTVKSVPQPTVAGPMDNPTTAAQPAPSQEAKPAQ